MRLEDLFPIATTGATGALGGASVGGTLMPGLGAIPGAAIGAGLGIGTGIYDAVRRSQAEEENAARLKELEAEAEKARQVNFDLYLRGAAQNEGEQARTIQQQAQEAGARGGLSQGQTFGLGLEAQTASAKQAADAKGAALLAASQAAGQEEGNVLNRYQVEQGLTNDALNVGSASNALGAVAGGAMQLASPEKQLKNYDGGSAAPAAPTKSAMPGENAEWLKTKSPLQPPPANMVPGPKGLTLPGNPPGEQPFPLFSNPLGFQMPANPQAVPAPETPAAAPAAAPVAPPAETSVPTQPAQSMAAPPAIPAPLPSPPAVPAVAPAGAAMQRQPVQQPAQPSKQESRRSITMPETFIGEVPQAPSLSESQQEPLPAPGESQVDYGDLAEASHPETFNRIARSDPKAAMDLLRSYLDDAMVEMRQAEASARQNEAIRQRTAYEDRGPLAPAYDRALAAQESDAKRAVAELPVQLPSRYEEAKSEVAADADRIRQLGDKNEAINKQATIGKAVAEFDLKQKQQQLADIQAQAAKLIEELKAYEVVK